MFWLILMVAAAFFVPIIFYKYTIIPQVVFAIITLIAAIVEWQMSHVSMQNNYFIYFMIHILPFWVCGSLIALRLRTENGE